MTFSFNETSTALTLSLICSALFPPGITVSIPFLFNSHANAKCDTSTASSLATPFNFSTF